MDEYMLPFLSNELAYLKSKIVEDIRGADNCDELSYVINKINQEFESYYSTLLSDYREYREREFNKWLENCINRACVQSAGSEKEWMMSFYFTYDTLNFFNPIEVEKIKEAALYCLNNDETASKVGKFVKVIDIQKDICMSTGFICSCIV